MANPYFISMDVNPKPIADVGNEPAARQWVALNQAGFMIVSHGLKVPSDTQEQPDRPANSLVGSWTKARWGFANASQVGYAAHVGRRVRVVGWDPDGLQGYNFESYGALWPFGEGTPVVPGGPFGAPFGILPLNPQASDTGGAAHLFTPVTCYNDFDMHSANNLPFGLGGWPDGFGWLISQEGVINNWGGPIPDLQPPPVANRSGTFNGQLGTGDNLVRDFQVNPSNNGEYAILYDNGFIHFGYLAPTGVGPRSIVGSPGSQPSPSHVALPDRGFRWMHIEWEAGWIISCDNNGGLWGYQLTGGQLPPPVPVPPPWGIIGAPGPGYFQSGDIIPGRDPSRFYLINFAGAAIAPAITGTIGALTIGFAAGEGPTNTTRPTLTWPYSETYAVSQAFQKVRVYPVAVTLLAGFVPGQQSGADHLNDRAKVVASGGTGSEKISRDLKNGGVYVAYVRVTSAAHIETAWTRLGGASGTFTMAIPVPATPSSCGTTLHPGAYPLFGTIDIAAGGGLGAGELRQFQVSTAGGPFVDVWGAEATTSATVTDQFPQTNVTLTYRVRTFKLVPGKIPSAWRTASPVVLATASGTPSGNRFVDYLAPGGPVAVEVNTEEFGFDRNEPRGEFQPMTTQAQTVTSGGVKGILGDLRVWSDDAAAYNALWKLLSLTRPIVYQSVLGRFWWVRPTPGRWDQELLAKLASETTPIRDSHEVKMRLTEVNPPR